MNKEHSPQRKKEKNLSPERIFEVALQLLDEQGLSALNMRALATKLEVKAASLYNHISSKSSLFLGIQELIFSKLKNPSTHIPWDQYLTKLAQAWRKMLMLHPKAIPLFANNPSLFSSALIQAEKSLRILLQAGFSEEQAFYLYQSLAVFVLGHALAESKSEFSEQSEEDLFQTALLQASFPTLTRIHQKIGPNTETWFSFGINFLIQGAASFLDVTK